MPKYSTIVEHEVPQGEAGYSQPNASTGNPFHITEDDTPRLEQFASKRVECRVCFYEVQHNQATDLEHLRHRSSIKAIGP